MPLAARFVDALKRCLRARGMTYAALARELRLSEASVKRMFSRGTFTLARIESILRALELDLVEVARMARGGEDQARELSLAQEELLASDERLLSVFWLLLNGWSFADVVEDFEITRTELTLALAWTLPCGVDSFTPYFYLAFLFVLLVDRAGRDDRRCQAKYGAAWDAYRRAVPYKLVPHLY